MLQLVGQGWSGVRSSRIDGKPSLGISIQSAQGSAEAFKGEAGLLQSRQLAKRQREQLLLPDLLNHLLHQGRGVGLELQLHRCATADRLAPKAATGEAVNGGDVCRIQLLQSQKQTTDPVASVAVVGAVAPPILQDLIRFR